MRNIMLKEMKLSASPLAYIFIVSGLMFMIPGYPILCGAFFTTLGLFQSFQAAREANDIVFSVLLPIAKKDVVTGKYRFVCLIEVCSLVLMIICTVIRMTVLADAPVYRTNALMNANLFALGAALIIFGLFNLIFLGGFFRTAYNLGRPFVTYIIIGFIAIGIIEALHHFPGLEILNSFGMENLGIQALLMIVEAALFVIMTAVSYRMSVKNFDRTDL